jgi:hypothetical protein
MNLQEWLQYRQKCPICESPLTLYFHSWKRQTVKIENGRLTIIFPLNLLKARSKTVDYKVGYSFGLTDNSFYIDFYDKNMFKLDHQIPLQLIRRFQELNVNLATYKFIKDCNTCKRYRFITNKLSLLFPQGILYPKELEIQEFFGFTQPYGGAQDNRFWIYHLSNLDDQSILEYWISSNITEATFEPEPKFSNVKADSWQQLILPLIPFSSPEKTLKRIQKLIIFS